MATVAWQAFDAATAASNADTYKQLNLFGDVFDRVRSDYVEVPEEEKLIESAINGMLTSLDPHSSYMNAEALPGNAGADPRRVRRPRHRSHDGKRHRQGRGADRRYAGRPRRHHGQ